MTTHSRARREAVAKALYVKDYAAVEAHLNEASETWDRYTDASGIRTRYLAMADDALAAALPDRAAFERAIQQHAFNARELERLRNREVERWKLRPGEWEAAFANYLASEQALIALVYGADAQDGDQEGAEHE